MPKLDLNNNFTYHPPNDTQRIKYEELRARYKNLAEQIYLLCPNDNREIATALTYLETSMFWANASSERAERAEKERDAAAPSTLQGDGATPRTDAVFLHPTKTREFVRGLERELSAALAELADTCNS